MNTSHRIIGWLQVITGFIFNYIAAKQGTHLSDSSF